MTEAEAKESLENWIRADLILAGVGPHDAANMTEEMVDFFKESVYAWMRQRLPVAYEASMVLDVAPFQIAEFELHL